jgi:DNA-binding transcriptional regulator YhcF (GntR family)
MSYKFQRLREKIRQAVASGELKGKLPGERELARRFAVNAKTLSKALTDLAAEGLLHRSIGRGTFVKGSADVEAESDGRWLLLTDAESDQSLIQNLQNINSQIEVSDDPASLRPSYINQFSAVIDLAYETPEAFLRDLLVRAIPVVTVGRESRTYSTNAVVLDSTLGVSHLTRDLVLAGHRRFLAIEARNRTTIAEAIRRSASRYCDDVSVDACFPRDVVCAMDYGATACICDSIRMADQTLSALNAGQAEVPEKISVAAVGWGGDEYPCTGYYVATRHKADAIAELLRHGQPGRPVTLWLTGTLVDRGTTANLAPAASIASVQQETQPAVFPSFPQLTLPALP